MSAITVAEDAPLDDLYLEWLYKNYIGPLTQRNPRNTYWGLAKQIHSKKFEAILKMDQNRAEKGICLRQDFINECGIEDIEVNWLQLECSMFEMLAGLACGASFNSLGEPHEWFMKFLDNLGLLNYNDASYGQLEFREVDLALEQLINRTYDKTGAGGLFPLNHAKRDQTKIELWYQLSAYLLEGGYLDNRP